MTTVTVFARDLDLAGHTDVFQPVLGHQPCVIAGTTGDDLDLLGVVKDLPGAGTERLFQNPVTGKTAFERIGDGPGLFVDFLLHEVVIFPSGRSIAGLTALPLGPLHQVTVTVSDGAAAIANIGDVTDL